MKILIYLLAALAFAFWLLAAINGFRMLGMLSGRLSLGAMLVRGIEWFNAENFKPEAAGPRQLFVRGFIGFIICVIALAILSVAMTQAA